VRTIVVGMHEALPDSLSAGHSMNETAAGAASGRPVYNELVEFRRTTQKKVYVLASHSHFYIDNIYNTQCRKERREEICPDGLWGQQGPHAIGFRKT
jgi:hypothetical protein